MIVNALHTSASSNLTAASAAAAAVEAHFYIHLSRHIGRHLHIVSCSLHHVHLGVDGMRLIALLSRAELGADELQWACGRNQVDIDRARRVAVREANPHGRLPRVRRTWDALEASERRWIGAFASRRRCCLSVCGAYQLEAGGIERVQLKGVVRVVVVGAEEGLRGLGEVLVTCI